MNRPPLLDNPFAQFAAWYQEAQKCKTIEQANAVCLSTTDLDRYPDGRMVLLKQFDERGFVFYTNYHSVKGRSLAAAPRAALTFYWEPLDQQVRIQGTTEFLTNEESDAYWATRPRLSQIGAWASLQSQPLDRNRTFIKRLSEYALKFGTGSVPRPPNWGGIRLKPRKIEFWRARRGRLHERFLYTLSRGQWAVQRLYP